MFLIKSLSDFYASFLLSVQNFPPFSEQLLEAKTSQPSRANIIHNSMTPRNQELKIPLENLSDISMVCHYLYVYFSKYVLGGFFT